MHRRPKGQSAAIIPPLRRHGPHRNDMVTGSLVFAVDVVPFDATIFEQFPLGAESADLLTLSQVTDFRMLLAAMRISSRHACKSRW